MRCMKFAITFATTLVLATGVAAGEMKRIKKEADFVALAVGKKLTIGSKNSVVISANGTSKGKFTSGRWVGNWAWQKGYFCTTGILGDRTIPQDCKLVKSDGETLRLTDNKGKGERSLDYKID